MEVDQRIAELLEDRPGTWRAAPGPRYSFPGQAHQSLSAEHADFFYVDEPYWAEYEPHGGQRTWTAMIYLNEPEAGGATRFKLLDFQVEPKLGRGSSFGTTWPSTVARIHGLCTRACRSRRDQVHCHQMVPRTAVRLGSRAPLRNARTAAAGSSFPQTAWQTARKSAPASTSGLRVVRRDPADRDAGDFEQGRPPGEDRRLRSIVGRLGRGRIESAERDIIRARLAASIARWRLSWQVLPICAEGPSSARASRMSPSLWPKMHAVGAEPLRERHAVVDDERHVSVGADALQRLGEPRQLVLVHVLDPQLERGGDARLQREPSDDPETRHQRPAG